MIKTGSQGELQPACLITFQVDPAKTKESRKCFAPIAEEKKQVKRHPSVYTAERKCRKLCHTYHPQPRILFASFIKWAFVFVLVGGLGVMAILFVGLFVQIDFAELTKNRQAPVFSPPISQRIDLINQTFHVPARQAVRVPFTLPRVARVSGSFQASGGKNDIQVCLVDEAGATNFFNGNAFRYYYQSGGYMTTDTINQTLPPGTFYLILNNRDAFLTNKTVSINLYAE